MPSQSGKKLTPAKSTIFSLMYGELVYGAEPSLESLVENEFTKGKKCMSNLQKIYNARIRLGERLETNEEDDDLLTIADGYDAIMRHLCITAELTGKREESRRLVYSLLRTRKDKSTYKKIMSAKAQIAARLGVDETDADLCAIDKGYCDMIVYLCKKMQIYCALLAH